jgi:uncharacterized tellurite resistance protein B-like protein
MGPTPDLLETINRAVAEAASYRAEHARRELSPDERERAVDALMEWLESDSLDWEAVERAHRMRV